MFKMGLARILGNRDSISFWNDIWMNDSPLIKKINPDKVEYIYKDAKDSDFIDDTKSWNLYNLRGCY